MKRILTLALALVLMMPMLGAQDKKGDRNYLVGFYNLENLFDIYDDPVKNDEEFLPDGKNKWTQDKYEKKLHNLATVIKDIAKEAGRYHTILGISEIENRLVIEDLVSQPEIADANYQIVHYDGPDRRGVDVALLYNPKQFTLLDSESIPFTFDSPTIQFDMDKAAQERFRTRDILMVHGLIDGEHCAFYVAHLPSRIGGKGGDLRSRGGEIMYQHAMMMSQKYPGIKIACMGDMNDNPTDESMAKHLHGKEKLADVTELDFFSPFLSMYKAGYGSLAYRGEWSIYDLILVNHALATDTEGLHIRPINKKGYYGRVFKKPYMTNKKGQYKGTPFRTFSGGAWIGGYSDHYPTYIILTK